VEQPESSKPGDWGEEENNCVWRVRGNRQVRVVVVAVELRAQRGCVAENADWREPGFILNVGGIDSIPQWRRGAQVKLTFM
jgi:hypothetical protein